MDTDDQLYNFSLRPSLTLQDTGFVFYNATEKERSNLFMVEVVIQALLLPFILIANSFVMIGPISWKELRTPDNILIISLSMADTMTGIISIPVRLLTGSPSHRSDFMEEELDCIVYHVFRFFPVGLSLSTLVLMCIDKFISLRFPNYYLVSQSNKKTLCVIGLVWIFKIVIFSVGFHNFSFDRTVVDLRERCNYERNFPAWYLTMIVSIAGLELFLSIVISIYIFVKVLRVEVNLSERRRSMVELFRAYRKGVRTDSQLRIVFIVLWSPAIIVNALALHIKDGRFLYYKDTMIWLPLCLNAALNAPIYAYSRQVNLHAYSYMLRTLPLLKRSLLPVIDSKEQSQSPKLPNNVKQDSLRDARYMSDLCCKLQQEKTLETEPDADASYPPWSAEYKVVVEKDSSPVPELTPH